MVRKHKCTYLSCLGIVIRCKLQMFIYSKDYNCERNSTTFNKTGINNNNERKVDWRLIRNDFTALIE